MVGLILQFARFTERSRGRAGPGFCRTNWSATFELYRTNPDEPGVLRNELSAQIGLPNELCWSAGITERTDVPAAERLLPNEAIRAGRFAERTVRKDRITKRTGAYETGIATRTQIPRTRRLRWANPGGPGRFTERTLRTDRITKPTDRTSRNYGTNPLPAAEAALLPNELTRLGSPDCGTNPSPRRCDLLPVKCATSDYFTATLGTALRENPCKFLEG